MSLPCVPRRLRALHPLIDGDGSCSLVYDLERVAVVEVPDDLQFYVAPALETGDLDEDLLSWLVSEDLLTVESWTDWESGMAGQPRIEDEIHGWLEPLAEDTAGKTLDLLFKRGFGCSRVTIHLDWPGSSRRPGSGEGIDRANCLELIECIERSERIECIERIVVDATRRAALAHQEIAFELALAPSQVTPEVACALAGYPLQLRLRCGQAELSGQPAAAVHQPWLAAEAPVRILLDRMPDALTVQCALAGPMRVLELWDWARRVGIRHLDAVRFEEPTAPAPGKRALPPPRASRARDFRNDLLAICEEICADLEARRRPIDFQPLWRIVRRLARGEHPMDLPSRAASTASVIGPQAGRARRPDLSSCTSADGAAEYEEGLLPCHACWARLLCSHSAYVASPLAGEDPRAPSEERCAFWLAEVEVALRLYHRLAQIDPIQLLRLVDLPARLPAIPLLRGPAPTSKPS